MATSTLLQLPQELRDLIYHYVCDDDSTANHNFTIDRRPKRLTTRHDRWQWDVQYTIRAPTATYLNLIKTSRQLRDEITEHLETAHGDNRPAARLEVLVDYPTITPTWTYIPCHPCQITILDLTIKVDKMYHPCFISRPPHNAILYTVFEVLKTYISFGPHLSKPTWLPSRLHLETVRITLVPPQPLQEMTWIYGFPEQQLELLYREFRTYVARLARSNLPYGDIDAFEIRWEMREWERFAVTKDVWDEDDRAFFVNGGYRWRNDSEEME